MSHAVEKAPLLRTGTGPSAQCTLLWSQLVPVEHSVAEGKALWREAPLVSVIVSLPVDSRECQKQVARGRVCCG